MKFTRGKRIALEVLAPPAIGAGLLTAIFTAMVAAEAVEKGDAMRRLGQVADIAMVAVVAAYALAGIQSALYAFVMEWRFTRGLDPRSWQTVGLSATLGFVSGGAIALVLSFSQADAALFGLVYFGGIGLGVGFVLGLLIKRLSR